MSILLINYELYSILSDTLYVSSDSFGTDLSQIL